jgi:hypothetical protein
MVVSLAALASAAVYILYYTASDKFVGGIVLAALCIGGAFYLIGITWWFLVNPAAFRGASNSLLFGWLTPPLGAAIFVVFGYAEAFKVFGIVEMPGGNVVRDPTACLYFSIVTFTTLGYGDFVPNKGSRMIAAS